MLHVWHLSVWNKVRSLLIGVMIVQNMVVIRCIYSLGTWKGAQDTLSHHLKPYLLFMTQNGITSILSSPSLVTISFPLNSCCTYFLLLFGLYLSLPILLNKSHILSFWLCPFKTGPCHQNHLPGECYSTGWLDLWISVNITIHVWAGECGKAAKFSFHSVQDSVLVYWEQLRNS